MEKRNSQFYQINTEGELVANMYELGLVVLYKKQSPGWALISICIQASKLMALGTWHLALVPQLMHLSFKWSVFLVIWQINNKCAGPIVLKRAGNRSLNGVRIVSIFCCVKFILIQVWSI